MLNQLKLYVSLLISLLAVDFVWIGLVANRFYVREFGEMGRTKGGKFDVIYWAAIGAYVLITLGLVLFVLPRVAADDPWWQAALYGAAFGLIVYGVYDCTNHATLKRWPMKLMAVDVAWGTFLSALGGVGGKFLRDGWLAAN